MLHLQFAYWNSETDGSESEMFKQYWNLTCTHIRLQEMLLFSRPIFVFSTFMDSVLFTSPLLIMYDKAAKSSRLT